MKITEVAIELIRPYEHNAKLHPHEQVEKLAKEISEVGWTQPIVVDVGGVVVAGHGRLLAAQRLGLKKVPVHRLPETISPERVRAMRLFDNRVSETGYDDDLLKNELQWLVDAQVSIDWTGFYVEQVQEFLRVPEIAEPKPIDDTLSDAHCLYVEVENEAQLKELYDELIERGMKVKIA